MDGDLAGMIVAVTFILTMGGVVILRPLSRRLGGLIEAMTQDRRRQGDARELAVIRDSLSNLESRLSLLEERQAFTEALLSDGARRPELSEARGSGPRTPDSRGVRPGGA